ncbi:protein of unknown function [Candidatus Nitrosacidococcus tergens]|uniref:Uncharacterized protein n=1 Tax=Candidatus Nitrosacidococcus tergens TaxID=553981 RepID=A0A7G1Q9T9_9GAMM|nr:protein of unknown function [Candidatus Nitrosacidococcus tergens]
MEAYRGELMLKLYYHQKMAGIWPINPQINYVSPTCMQYQYFNCDYSGAGNDQYAGRSPAQSYEQLLQEERVR